MTFSIVALDQPSGQVAVAAASRFLAVGAYIIHARSNVGAVASQARANPLLGLDALDGMAAGQSVEQSLAEVMETDDGRAIRQCHAVDMAGRTAAWTGDECVEWAGHKTFEGFSVAGNMLTGKDVLAAMAATYREAAAAPFAERLLAALDAGDSAGGDKRGRQSAAIYVAGAQPYAELDSRVDDHEQPFKELRRLYELSKGERVQSLREQMPRRSDTAVSPALR